LLRLLQLAKPVRDMLENGGLDMGHARALLSLTPEDQQPLGERIVAENLSVRQAERLVQQHLNPEAAAEQEALDTQPAAANAALSGAEHAANGHSEQVPQVVLDAMDAFSESEDKPDNEQEMLPKAAAPAHSPSKPEPPPVQEYVDPDLLRLQEEVADHLGAAVTIRANPKGAGKMTIQFSSLDELDGILEALGVKVPSYEAAQEISDKPGKAGDIDLQLPPLDDMMLEPL